MMRTPALLSWSGGKDAAWALHVLRQRGEIEVIALLTTITSEFQRASMQGIRREVLDAQAVVAGLPLLAAEIPAHCDNAAYEAAMARALAEAEARWPGLRSVAFGDLFLPDIRAYRESRCASAGWQALFPLFGSDTTRLARDMIDGGLRGTLCCVDTQQLSAGFAGRDFDASLLRDLPGDIDSCGENGEFHTCVQDGPMFDNPIRVERGETVLRDGRFAYTDFQLL